MHSTIVYESVKEYRIGVRLFYFFFQRLTYGRPSVPEYRWCLVSYLLLLQVFLAKLKQTTTTTLKRKNTNKLYALFSNVMQSDIHVAYIQWGHATWNFANITQDKQSIFQHTHCERNFKMKKKEAEYQILSYIEFIFECHSKEYKNKWKFVVQSIFIRADVKTFETFDFSGCSTSDMLHDASI